VEGKIDVGFILCGDIAVCGDSVWGSTRWGRSSAGGCGVQHSVKVTDLKSGPIVIDLFQRSVFFSLQGLGARATSSEGARYRKLYC
jgi:hypothetical protein